MTHQEIDGYESIMDSADGDLLYFLPEERNRWQDMIDCINKKHGRNLTILPSKNEKWVQCFVLREIGNLEGEERKLFITLEKERGRTYSEIGKQLGLSRQRVQAIAGAKERRSTGAVLTPEFVKMYKEGLGTQTIAEKFKVSTATVLRALRKAGVQIREVGGKQLKERRKLSSLKEKRG